MESRSFYRRRLSNMSYQEVNEIKIAIREFLTEKPDTKFTTLKSIKDHFKINHRIIKKLFHGEIFAEIPPSLDNLRWQFQNKAGRKGTLTDEQVIRIRELYWKGMSCNQIKREMRLKMTTMGIWKVANWEIYSHVGTTDQEEEDEQKK